MTQQPLPEKQLPTRKKRCILCAAKKHVRVAVIMLGTKPLCLRCAVSVIRQRKAVKGGTPMRRQNRDDESDKPFMTSIHRQNREPALYVEGTISFIDQDVEQTRDQRTSSLSWALLCQRFHCCVRHVGQRLANKGGRTRWIIVLYPQAMHRERVESLTTKQRATP